MSIKGAKARHCLFSSVCCCCCFCYINEIVLDRFSIKFTCTIPGTKGSFTNKDTALKGWTGNASHHRGWLLVESCKLENMDGVNGAGQKTCYPNRNEREFALSIQCPFVISQWIQPFLQDTIFRSQGAFITFLAGRQTSTFPDRDLQAEALFIN